MTTPRCARRKFMRRKDMFFRQQRIMQRQSVASRKMNIGVLKMEVCIPPATGMPPAIRNSTITIIMEIGKIITSIIFRDLTIQQNQSVLICFQVSGFKICDKSTLYLRNTQIYSAPSALYLMGGSFSQGFSLGLGISGLQPYRQ